MHEKGSIIVATSRNQMLSEHAALSTARENRSGHKCSHVVGQIKS